MVTTAPNYYRSVVEATQEYLGPAAERFIKRQIEFHLNKDPEAINQADVLKLKESLRVALGLLVSDKSIADQAVRRLEQIAKG
jgi:hypothetical protein